MAFLIVKSQFQNKDSTTETVADQAYSAVHET